MFAAPTMPNARARLAPTTSMMSAPTTARTIWVWTTAGWRAGFRDVAAGARARCPGAAATGRRTAEARSSFFSSSGSMLNSKRFLCRRGEPSAGGGGCGATATVVAGRRRERAERGVGESLLCLGLALPVIVPESTRRPVRESVWKCIVVAGHFDEHVAVVGVEADRGHRCLQDVAGAQLRRAAGREVVDALSAACSRS